MRHAADSDDDAFAGEPPTDIDPYKVLEIPETATDEEVRKAYRRAALKNHPGMSTPRSAARLCHG